MHAGGRELMSGFISDLRLSLRGLRKQRGFTLAAVGVLSLAIGANAVLLGVVRAVLFRSPAGQPERLWVLWEQDLERDRPLLEVSYANFADWREESRAFEDMAAFSSVNWESILTGVGDPYPVSSAAVSSSFFDVLSVRPLLGRTFHPEDDEPGAPGAVVLSFGLWQERFGGDPALLGRAIQLEGDSPSPKPFIVIGVMPRGFDFPRGASIWMPVRRRLESAALLASQDVEQVLRRLNVLFLVGRLAPGLHRLEAEAESNGILQRIAETQGWPRRTVVQTSFNDFYLGGRTRRGVIVVWASVGLLLLVACANVAGMLVVKASARARELAIRHALGASRARIVRHVLLDAVWVGAAGGLFGSALAMLALSAIRAFAPTDVPRLDEAGLDGMVLLLSSGLALASAAASALGPALRAAGSAGGSPSRVVASRESRTLHGALVVLEVAVALALALGAGLMAQSLRNLNEADLGYEPEKLLTFELPHVESRHPTSQDQHRFLDELLPQLASLPGVESAAAAYLRPLETAAVGMDSAFIAEGQPFEPETADSNPLVNWEAVTPGYFRTMGIQVLSGRDFAETDSTDGPAVAIVGESLARRIWPSESALGKRLWSVGDRDPAGEPVWRTIVGVVEDARYRGLTDTRLDMYLPHLQSRTNVSDVLLRTTGDPLALAASVRAEIAALDPNQPVDGITTLSALVDRALSPWKLTTSVLGLFAGMTLALALTGLAFVLAFSVSRRTQEIGVRMALGATRRQVGILVLKQGLPLVAMGTALGLLLGFALTRLLSELLYEVEPSDLRSFASISALVWMAFFAASLAPASRAARVEPIAALRHE
jgi:putative ABC transport system permease protein